MCSPTPRCRRPEAVTVTAPAALRILGVDPGSRVTGYGLVDDRRDSLVHVQSGQIKPGNLALPGRLEKIFNGMNQVIAEYRPDLLAVEQVFMARNAHSALVLGHARGAVICAAVRAGLPVAEYGARRIKQAVVGYGAADKQQVQHMVRALLGMTQPPAEDAADALACAICHAHSRTRDRRLAAAGAQS